MPDVFLYCHLLEACDLDGSSERLPAPAVARVRVLAGAVLRLAHRALESHLLAAGDASRYETTIRLTHACTRAAALLDDSAAKPEGPAVLLEQAHFALWALGEAAAATAEPNPAVVCERLVDAIARLLVVFIVVSPLSADRPAPQLAEA